jgi:hypothetical protein
MLLIVYKTLTLTFVIIKPIGSIMVKLNVFESLAFNEEATLGFFQVELSLFKKFTMLDDPFIPLIWCAHHEQQFFNLSYRVHQVMDVVGSQIKTKNIFSIVNFITSLKCC